MGRAPAPSRGIFVSRPGKPRTAISRIGPRLAARTALAAAELRGSGLWTDARPEALRAAWTDLRQQLLIADEGWEVRTVRHEARRPAGAVAAEIAGVEVSATLGSLLTRLEKWAQVVLNAPP